MRAVLVGVCTGDENEFAGVMDELESLAEACEFQDCLRMVQNLEFPNPTTFIGSGKLVELGQLVNYEEMDCVIFSDTLTPAQLKNISREIECRLLDYTGLILEIFAKRARTREARLQVESANLQYMLPRLVGMRTSLGRQGGGSGSMSNKGQGEKQIDLDRRHIERRITELNRELDAIEHNREVQRKQRNKSNIPAVALSGYTNAGKSTLLNYLISLSGVEDEKKVFEKDMLFATLDTATRRISTGDKKDFVLSDTVGFISNLPHGLIKAFRSTLEEVRYADLILVVADVSDERHDEQIKITEDTLKEIEADSIPRLYVLNKADRTEGRYRPGTVSGDRVYISAATGDGVDVLLEEIKKRIYSSNRIIELTIPYSEGYKINLLNENARVISQSYEEEGTRVVADCPKWLIGQLIQ